jgi:hypothetical protein
VLLLWIYLSAEIEKMWPTPDGPYAEDGDDQAKLDVD